MNSLLQIEYCKLILRMTAIESMYSLSNSKYVGIFDFIEDTVKIRKSTQE